MGIPTEEGKKRYPYPPVGIYKDSFLDPSESEFWEACTCKPECPKPCKGECGCRACHCSWGDFLSEE